VYCETLQERSNFLEDGSAENFFLDMRLQEGEEHLGSARDSLPFFAARKCRAALPQREDE